MDLRSTFPVPGLGLRTADERSDAARRALTICESADAMAREANESMDLDDDRLFGLLEQREQMLADLAAHVVTLRIKRPTADRPLFDSPLLASTAHVVNDADALVTEVCKALSRSQQFTMALALRVADRAGALRAELAEVHRAGSASVGYAMRPTPHQLDSIR